MPFYEFMKYVVLAKQSFRLPLTIGSYICDLDYMNLSLGTVYILNRFMESLLKQLSGVSIIVV